MSRHQLFRNYDYQNDMDEYDGFESGEEEEQESAEDRQLMRDAITEVRRVLGDKADKVTETQIQEAVWHYYYDVDKSVAYLTKKFIATPAQPAKSATSTKKGPQDGSRAYPLPPTRAARVSYAAFFADMPWLSVPQSRQTVFVPPGRSKGGLLGGASAPTKMSKLQALAAQRKRKVEEAKKAKEHSGPSEEGRPDADVRGLRNKAARLSIGSSSPRPSGEPSSSVLEPSQEAVSSTTQYGPSQFDSLPVGNGPGPSGAALIREQQSEAPLIAEPSPFAQALFGPKRRRLSRDPESELLAVPSLSRAPSSAFEAFLGPSPDDVVLEAQAKAWKQSPAGGAQKVKAAANGADAKNATALTNGVKALKMDDTPLPRSKNLNVLNEYERSKKKKSASFVVVGHVDAGKSTMMGRLLLDLKFVDNRTIEKYRKQAESIGKSSFALAWVLDQGTDEREHGVTIDIATRHFETDTTAFTILDAPGHRDFIPNMIAGASQADFAILVVDASTGAFESGLKGQTREHALLMRSMGVARIIVAVNKLDTVDWSKERFDEITHQVSGFLSATGFQIKNVSFVPVSGLNGDNLVAKTTNPAASWYTGSTLIEELEKSEPLARALDKPLRFQISEAFKTAASAITVSGRIEAGSLQMGDALLVLPASEKAYIKSLVRDGEAADWAVAGQNVVLHLSNIDPEHVKVGDVICDPAKPITCIDAFSMKALAFDILFPMPVEVHRGRLNEPAVIQELTALLNKSTAAVTKKKPKVVKPGNVARIQVKLKAKVPLESGQRVVLRTSGQTIAAGLLE